MLVIIMKIRTVLQFRTISANNEGRLADAAFSEKQYDSLILEFTQYKPNLSSVKVFSGRLPKKRKMFSTERGRGSTRERISLLCMLVARSLVLFRKSL